jgi:hypothetical protein
MATSSARAPSSAGALRFLCSGELTSALNTVETNWLRGGSLRPDRLNIDSLARATTRDLPIALPRKILCAAAFAALPYGDRSALAIRCNRSDRIFVGKSR